MRTVSLTKPVAALAVMSTLYAGGLSLAGSAFAADPSKPADAVAAATQSKSDGALLKTVDEAYKALREIRAARLAIFNGQAEQASKFVADAQKDLAAAKALVPTHAIKDKKTPQAGDSYLPIDTSLTLAEGFKATPEKQTAIGKANEHLSKGDHKQAVEVLKAANIDITVSAALIPTQASLAHVADAAKLMGEKKYYEANIALKAVEDSIIIVSYSLDDVPKQG